MQLRELTDRYQLQKILKSTRFGTVLRATDIASGETVVVKLITVGPFPGLAAAPDFERLAAGLAEPGYPHLPALLDSGFTTDGSAFLVLELLEGKGFDTLAGAPPNQALALVSQALNGLEALAGRGLVHHNLSPDNVFLVPGPGGGQVKLLGLGTALFRPRGPEAAAGLGAESARFRAPELAAGGSGDARADLFSLALTACHALGATVGFGDTPVVQLPLAVSFELENDEALRQALERSLRRDPGERPTPAELREALRKAAPEIPELPPKESGELLTAVDDEVLNALPSVPPPPPRPVEPQPGGTAKVVPFQRTRKAPAPAPIPGTAVPIPARAPGALTRRPAVLGAIAGLLVLCGLTAFWLLTQSRPEAVAAPRAAANAAALPKPPSEPPTARLEEAKLLFGQGEDRSARRRLRSIPFGEQGLLPPQGCRELGALEETLALTAFEHLASDLSNGLDRGDMDVLQDAVEAATGQEEGLAPKVRANLDWARSAVEAYSQARAAAGQGDNVQVLERFAALAELLPGAGDPEKLRDKAAGTLESEAEALIGEARYAEALAKLGPIQRSWPGRPGLKERLARYETWQRNEKEQESLLAALPGLERRKKPLEALEALKGVAPTPHLAPRFAQARVRLEDLLARLDRQPPDLVLRDGYLLDYARGTVAELSFRATDDYEVKDVKVLARPEGGKFREMKLEKTRAGYYTVEIEPGFHQNGTVDLYAVATDLSGHETSLGSREKPLQLKRKQGSERLIR